MSTVLGERIVTAEVVAGRLCTGGSSCLRVLLVNPLTPNDPYRGRTAPLTAEVAFYIFIQQI